MFSSNRMAIWMVVCFAVLAATFGSTISTAEATEFYVSPSGKETASGSKQDPFASLQLARDAVRRVSGASPITVFVRGGSYFLPNGIKFEKQDGGTAEFPTIWKAYADEVPILVGGLPIDGFVPHKGKILKADLKSQGFRDANFKQLVFNGQRQILARYPNYDPDNPYAGGWAYADGEYIPMYKDVPGENRRSLVYKPKDARVWSRPQDVEVFVFPRYNWWNNICRIDSVDRDSRMITLATDASYPIRPSDRYYFQGAIEDLDSAGEWYLDKETQTLFFWPPGSIRNESVFAPTTRTILNIGSGTSHLMFEGFTIECAEGDAVTLNQTNDCRIARCTIRNVGDYRGSGVTVRGGVRNGVIGCDIHNIGRSAISLSGGDVPTLTPAGNYADNNYIHHTGVYYKQGVGVSMTGVGHRATHNLIHDCPRFGIGFHGNNLAIEYNHIRHVNLETADTGAVYTGGRDWLGSRGTVIRHNYFHDILGFGFENGKWESPHFGWGVYLDDNTGGVDVIGNIVARAKRGLIHLHSSRDNRIENNVFIDGDMQQIECSGWTATGKRWNEHFDEMVKGYNSVAGQPAWQSMRNMDVPPNDAVLPDGTVMSGNTFLRNIICYGKPQSNFVRVRDFSFDHNFFDYNLIWHDGLPINTGQAVYGRPLSDNLAPNPSFERGTIGQMPQLWRWQIHPHGDSVGAMEVVSNAKGMGQGNRVLRIDADFDQEKPRDNFPIIVSEPLELKLGKAYRLTAKMKSDHVGAKANLMLQSYVANAYFWANWPSDCDLTTDWTEQEVTFQIPQRGADKWHEKMTTFRVRIDFSDESGSLWVDDVRLVEIESLDPWTSWQAKGMDQHSLVADPMFVDRANDDYRLKPDSPAFDLGFERIPVEKIGPHSDTFRASWPIVEATGAREKPFRAHSDHPESSPDAQSSVDAK
ncbi:right-handed parallel beta-helix repeat-containing protein [Novipirellula herctigrandis]